MPYHHPKAKSQTANASGCHGTLRTPYTIAAHSLCKRCVTQDSSDFFTSNPVAIHRSWTEEKKDISGVDVEMTMSNKHNNLDKVDLFRENQFIDDDDEEDGIQAAVSSTDREMYRKGRTESSSSDDIVELNEA